MSAILNTPQAVRRRRAFYSAMAPLVGTERALEAIGLWERTFGAEQALLRGLTRYAQMVVHDLKWPMRAGDLTVLLLSYLQQDESTLQPDPLPLMRGEAVDPGTLGVGLGFAPAPAARGAGPPPVAASPRSVPRADPWRDPGPPAPPVPRAPSVARTLGVLVLALIDEAGQSDVSHQDALLRAFIAACNATLSLETGHDLSQLLRGNAAELRRDYDTPTGATIVNALYVPLCDYYGPVEADRIVTTSVRAAERTVEGRALSPRELL